MATITGTSGADTLTGTTSNDTISGLAGNDTLSGGAGNDTLIGGGGADVLNGGDGTDTAGYTNATGGVTLNLKTGVHTGDAAGDTFISIEKFEGSGYADTFVADANATSFDGYSGTDTVDYSTSSAAVQVNLVTGTGTGGDAEGDGYSRIERVIGTAFADTMTSSTSGHHLVGGAGNDIYVIGNQGLTVTEAAGQGYDEVRTGLSSLSIEGWANVEQLTYTGTGSFIGTGNSGDNIIVGGSGNDTLIGGGGADVLNGGDGTDTAGYTNATGGVTLNLKTGVHTGDAAGDTFISIEKFEGSGYADTFVADANATSFDGYSGTDTVDYSTSSAAVQVNLVTGTGTGGDAEGDGYSRIERVIGTAFADTMTSSTSGHHLVGGAGNDIYVIGNQGLTVTEAAGQGYDEVRTGLSSLSIEGWANVEQLTYTGTGSFIGTGNSGDNIIVGGSGNDTLIGGGGADVLNGGDGTDTAGYTNATGGVTLNLKTGVHTGDAAGDTFISIEKFEGSGYADTFVADANATSFDGYSGTDTVDYSTSSAAVQVNLVTGTGTGGDAEGDGYSRIERVIGTAFADTMTSSTSGHHLVGGAGNDIYVIGNQGLTVTEAAGQGYDEVRTGLSSLSIEGWANVEQLTYTGTGSFIGTGNSGDNIIVGGSGNDTLIGGGGADVLNGGDGTDTAGYTNATGGVTLNLKTGVHTGDAAGDTFISIEKFEGSGYADTFVADANATSFDGYSGTDTVDYSTSSAAVQVNLVTGTGTGGDAEGDGYSRIERVIGTAFADTMTSSTSGHQLVGGAGNDAYVIGNQGLTVTEAAGQGYDEVRTGLSSLSIEGWANVEQLTYTGTGSFIGTGNSGDNIIVGGSGNDTLIGGGGADVLNGGDGTDTAGYTNATGGVTLNLKTGVHTGDAAGDTFISIEKFEGSGYADTFVADANATSFDGYSGTDTVDYSTSSAAVQVNLVTGTGTGGDAEGDGYSRIERVIGTAFADTMTSSTSGHQLVGGAGNDAYVVGNQSVTVTEAAGEGIDEVRTTLTSYTLGANLDNLTYTGTSNFFGNGNELDNVITSAVGKDTLTAGAGNDTIIGGDGADKIDGGSGSDTSVYSGSDAGVTIDLANNIAAGGHAEGDVLISIENLVGSQHVDSLLGSSIANWLDGQDGDDTLDGREGDDVLIGGAGADILIGGSGTDAASYITATSAVSIDLATGVHSGDAAGDTFDGIEEWHGSNHNDILVGSASDETLRGGVGNDLLDGGAGADILDGGNGFDTVSYAASSAAVSIDLSTNLNSGGDAEGDTLLSVEHVVGSSFADTLISSGSGQVWEGGLGGDTIIGGAGLDTSSYQNSASGVSINLDAGTGTGGDAEGDVLVSIDRVVGSAHGDTLIASGQQALEGGIGDDVYVVGSADVVIVEDAGAGIDEIRTSLASLALAANVEKLTYIGTGSFTAQGNALANTLTGGGGDDVLIGGAGGDTLVGGDGTDTASYATAGGAVTINLRTGVHTGDAAGDTFDSIERLRGSNHNDTFVADSAANNFDGGNGTDTVDYSASASAVTVNLSTGANTGGDAEGDILTSIEKVIGSSFGDHLTASASGQILQGGAGDDVYVVNAASVTITEAASGGNDTVHTSLGSYSLASNVETLIYTGSADFIGTGNSANNTIVGGSGNDTLRGGGGADLLVGGAGIDTASYSNAGAGVTIDLGTGVHGGDAAGDTFDGIEGFLGSNHADTFIDGNVATTFRGGSGDDRYIIDSASTVVTELAGGGSDTVETTLASYTLGANVENLVYEGTSSFIGSGNELDNSITGGTGNDVLNGQAGLDALFGGGGADTFVFDSASEATTGGLGDLIQDFSQADGDLIDLSQFGSLHFVGTEAFSNTAGEFRYEANGGMTTVFGDLDGDGIADCQIQLTGSIDLTASDFLI